MPLCIEAVTSNSQLPLSRLFFGFQGPHASVPIPAKAFAATASNTRCFSSTSPSLFLQGQDDFLRRLHHHLRFHHAAICGLTCSENSLPVARARGKFLLTPEQQRRRRVIAGTHVHEIDGGFIPSSARAFSPPCSDGPGTGCAVPTFWQRARFGQSHLRLRPAKGPRLPRADRRLVPSRKSYICPKSVNVRVADAASRTARTISGFTVDGTFGDAGRRFTTSICISVRLVLIGATARRRRCEILQTLFSQHSLREPASRPYAASARSAVRSTGALQPPVRPSAGVSALDAHQVTRNQGKLCGILLHTIEAVGDSVQFPCASALCATTSAAGASAASR